MLEGVGPEIKAGLRMDTIREDKALYLGGSE